MKFPAQDWPAISALLDEAFDLPAEQRGPWLDALPEHARVYRDTLASLLADRARVETQDFLHTLPKLDPAGEGAAVHDADPTRAIGPYRLLHEIGRGGMGSVWLAERSDGLLKRPVALKLPHPGIATRTFAERLARERDILASLAHPNIARLYDAGISADGQPYIALEYVPGASLIEHCDAARLGISARIGLFLQVLAAVQFAHAHLVIHRDLKPSNVLVDEQGQVRLLDFGIAKLMIDGQAQQTALTEIGGVALTPDYASPEQISGATITTASDIYSLGVLLYELLTGARPYRLKRGTRAALEEAILAADVGKASEAVREEAPAQARGTSAGKLARALRGDLDTITLKALKKPIADRYGSVELFAQDLQRHLRGDAVHARADSAWYHAQRFVGRNKLAFGAAAGIFAALLAGLGVALWQADVASREARTAQAVQAFLQDIFRANATAQADPVKARQTTARELLDIGAKRIESSLKNVPAARLGVLETLASMYGDLRLTEPAVRIQRQRVETARSLYGAGDARLAAALIDLANELNNSEFIAERERATDEAKRVLDRAGDHDSPTRAKLLRSLAYQLYDKDPVRALEFAERGLTLQRRHPPDEALEDALGSAAVMCGFVNQPRRAEALYREALAVSKVVHAASVDMQLPELYTYLGDAQTDLQDLAAAEASYRLAARAARSVGDEDGLEAIRADHGLGLFLFEVGRVDEGLALMQSAEQRALKTRDAEDPLITPWIMTGLAASLIRAGRFEEGLERLTRVEASERKHSPGAMVLAKVLERQAAGLIEQGAYEQARNKLDEAQAIEAKLGAGAEPAEIALGRRVHLLVASGQADAAAKLLADAQAQTIAPQQHFLRWWAGVRWRGEVALAQGRNDDAAAIFAAARDEMARGPGAGFRGFYEAQALRLQGKALAAAHRCGQAQPLLERVLEPNSPIGDRTRSPAVADVQIALAECAVEAGQLARARARLAEAQAIQRSHARLGQQYTAPLHALESRLAVQGRPAPAAPAATPAR